MFGVIRSGQYYVISISFLMDSVTCILVRTDLLLSVILLQIKWILEVLTISSNKELQINEEIRDKELRIIDSEGGQLGIMSASQALDLAAEKNLDLVKIAPNAQPPVCKIMDYGKYRFEQAKKEKEARKNQKVIDTKEIRLSLNIDTHDFNTKLNHAQKFIKSGDRIKVSIRFRGREMGFSKQGLDTMERFATELADVCIVEKQPKLEGRSMMMFLAPKPNK